MEETITSAGVFSSETAETTTWDITTEIDDAYELVVLKEGEIDERPRVIIAKSSDGEFMKFSPNCTNAEILRIIEAENVEKAEA